MVIISIIALSRVMYGFQETQADEQRSEINHPDHEEIEAELIIQMTPLETLLPKPAYWCPCCCDGREAF